MSDLYPSVQPPWSRPLKSPQAQTMTSSGEVSVMADVTYLAQGINTPPTPATGTLLDGRYKQQIKRILIPADLIATTETWIVTGKFANFNTLTFDSVGYNAFLEWDGVAWHQTGGNAAPSNYDTGGIPGPSSEVISANATVNLNVPTSWLQSQSLTNIVVTLPNGSFVNQRHEFLIPAAYLPSATFVITGVFATGASTLSLPSGLSTSTYAAVMWDGTAWTVTGGTPLLA